MVLQDHLMGILKMLERNFGEKNQGKPMSDMLANIVIFKQPWLKKYFYTCNRIKVFNEMLRLYSFIVLISFSLTELNLTKALSSISILSRCCDYPSKSIKVIFMLQLRRRRRQLIKNNMLCDRFTPTHIHNFESHASQTWWYQVIFGKGLTLQ